uniref:Uncharacterized protein n=1 Tax=Anguilla anguilla TaxID=7936 RepID=A0A0E9VWQ1_ANGAN
MFLRVVDVNFKPSSGANLIRGFIIGQKTCYLFFGEVLDRCLSP